MAPARGLGVSGFVLHSVPFALWALWSRSPSLLEGLHRVVLQGRDADSTGAMAGALLGAALGREAIPDSLADRLEPCFSASREGLAEVLRGAPPAGGPGRPSSLALRGREIQVKLGVALHVLARLVP